MQKTIFNKLANLNRIVAAFAGVGIVSQNITEALLELSKKDPKTIGKFFVCVASTCGIVSVMYLFCKWRKIRAETKAYQARCKADAELYERQKMADAELYTLQKQADQRLVDAKRFEVEKSPKPASSPSGNENGDKEGTDDGSVDKQPEAGGDEENGKTLWADSFHKKHQMPQLPFFLLGIIAGTPSGFQDAMLFHLLSAFGALCFSRVRSKYLDGMMHAPNIMTIIEGNSGSGKDKFAQAFKLLFERIIEKAKQRLDDNNQGIHVIQYAGISATESRFLDFLANNQGVHMFFFGSEIIEACNKMKRNNGLSFEHIRKAFENGDVMRINKDKNASQGFFPVYLNCSFTGTPADVDKFISKEVEGGTASRFCWSRIPDLERIIPELDMPDGYELKDMQDLIDKWHDNYCFSTDSEGNDKVAPEHVIDLDYVNEALREWSENTQWKLSYEGQDKARNDARGRMCTIAFHCAIVIHMLFDEQELDDAVKKQGVIDLTTYIADYCMERYLHKFGRELNELHKKNLEAEMIDDSANPTQGDQAQGKKLVTDIAELARLHSIKDKRGQNKYGWDTLVEMSGMARSTLMNKVKKYEKNHTK